MRAASSFEKYNYLHPLGEKSAVRTRLKKEINRQNYKLRLQEITFSFAKEALLTITAQTNAGWKLTRIFKNGVNF